MYCSKCGSPLNDSTGICTSCGLQHAMPDDVQSPVEDHTANDTAYRASAQYYGSEYGNGYGNPQPPYQGYYAQPPVFSEENIPPQYKPLGAWTYFWLTVLYSLPIIGFIFLIIHSVDDSNLNRRGYARSFWCALLVAVIVIVAIILIEVVLAVVFGLLAGGMASTPVYYY